MSVKIAWIKGKLYVRVHFGGKVKTIRAGDTPEEAEQLRADIEVLLKIQGWKALEQYGRKKKAVETVGTTPRSTSDAWLTPT